MLMWDGIFTQEFEQTQQEKMPATMVALLTRFNMVIPSFRERAPGLGGSEWVRRRTKIFKSLTLPSILRQHRRPDYWFLGLDSTNKSDTDELRELISAHPWIVPVWQEAGEPIHSPFMREIEQRLDGFGCVITARLDNDDALHWQYFSALWTYASAVIAAKHPDNFWVSFPFGVQAKEREVRALMWPANSFLARCETRERFGEKSTAIFGNHDNVFRNLVFQATTQQPMWLMNVHGENVGNRMLENRPLFQAGDMLKENFGIDPDRDGWGALKPFVRQPGKLHWLARMARRRR